MDILPLFQCLQPHVTVTTLRQFHRMAFALLVMTGRITMLGLSRWAGQGGSYRTVQRFFSTVLPWATLFWVFFRQHLYRPGDVYVLAGDEVVVTKAGKHTHGLDRFFASLYGKPVPGLAFFMLSLVSTQERRSFPLHVEQVVRSEVEKAASKAKAAAKQQKPATDQRRGRPKGSKNKNKAEVTLTPELGRIKVLHDHEGISLVLLRVERRHALFQGVRQQNRAILFRGFLPFLPAAIEFLVWGSSQPTFLQQGLC
jgi:putative transposase